MTFDPGAGQVPQLTAAAGGDSTAAPLEPFTPPVEPVQAPRVAPAKAAKPAGRAGVATVLLAVGLLVAVGGVAFAVGRVTAPAAAATAGGRGAIGANAGGGLVAPGSSLAPGAGGVANGSFVPGAFGDRGFGGALGGLTGTVTAITDDTLTITIGTGGRTVEIPLDSSTRYHTETAATAAAVTVGSDVTVRTSQGAAPAGQAQGPQGQGQQGDQAPQASGALDQGGVPGAGGPPGLTLGTATDVTVIAGGAQ